MSDAVHWTVILGAALGYVLGGTGIVSQVITWRRMKSLHDADAARIKAIEDSKVGVAKITGDVQIAKITGDVAMSEREATGRFQAQLLDSQAQLLDRLGSLERARVDDEERISELEAHNGSLLKRLEEIATLHGKLLGDHDQLKQDHEQLKRHVSKLEADNRAMRQKLARAG